MDVIERYQADDEIDLFELFSSLMQQWRWIVGITVVGTVLSIVIALAIPKEYQVGALVVLPSQPDVTLISNRGVVTETRSGLFQKYHMRLVSAVNLDDYLQQNDWLSKIYPQPINTKNKNELTARLRELLKIEVTRPKQTKNNLVVSARELGLTMFGEDESLVTDFINGYIGFTGEALLASLKKDGKRLKALEIDEINQSINLLRADAKRRLTSRRLVLNDALVLAKKIGIKKPNSMRLSPNKSSSGIVVNAVNSGSRSDLFLQGSEYLMGEINNIQQRKLSDAYIPALLPLLKRLEELSNVSFDFEETKPYKVDKPATVDGQAEKPKRVLIVTAGGVLSLFIGIFASLIVGAVKRRRALA